MPQAHLPQNVQEVFEQLQEQLVLVIHKWHIYSELFCKSDTVDLMNRVSPPAFGTFQTSMVADVIMTLARFSDPASSGKNRDNLSVQQLEDLASPHYSCGRAGSLSSLVKSFRTSCKPLRAVRNKSLAHSDLATAKSSSGKLVPGITKEVIDQLLKDAAEILNHVDAELRDNHTEYFHLDTEMTAEGLLNALRTAIDATHESPNRPSSAV